MSQKYARSKLNQGQIEVLELLYKYRFGSRQLLAISLKVNAANGLYEKLEALVSNGYIDRRFDKRLKLQGKPVAYHLLPKGLRVLQALPRHEYINEQAMRLCYQNKRVGNAHVEATLNIYKYTQHLQKQYPGLKVFTQQDMSHYSYFPKPLPDIFLSLPSTDVKNPHRFFLDIVQEHTPRYVLDRRLASYVEFFDEGGWDKVSSELPVLLVVNERNAAEKSTQRSVQAQLQRLGSELRAYTATVSAIENAAVDRSVWTDVNDTDDVVALDEISVNS